MTTPTVVTGDYVSLAVTLKKNGVTFSISDTAEVKAALVDPNRTRILAGPVVQSSETPGAAWGNSLVVVVFEPDDTVAMTQYGGVILEIQVSEDDKPQTWFSRVNVVKGNIP